jgi:cytochrome c oxidase cbb3-type subunit III
MTTRNEKDPVSGTETTGHEWDGVKELNTPLPKWWLYTFIVTVVWGLGYTVLYPAWPGLSGHTRGILGFEQRSELAGALAIEQARLDPVMQRIAAAPIADVLRDPELMGYVMAGGRQLFADNCAGCHGAGGAGAVGYPNLADDDWIWGGTAEQILQTVAYGVRNAHPDTRQSEMPRFGTDRLLTPAQIADVADYVLSLSGTSLSGSGGDPAVLTRGTAVYAENCASCHGDGGQGNIELGAPRLSDAIWLYGGDRASVIQTISLARRGNMPAWSERLDPATTRVLAAYVHAMGGGR